jgi:hypothetical protein
MIFFLSCLLVASVVEAVVETITSSEEEPAPSE